MDAAEMVEQLKARRNSIQTELDRINAKLDELTGLLGKGYTLDVPVPPELSHALQEPEHTRYKGTRVPLSQRRVALLSFLSENGPSTRAQIIAGTGIPAGSLSALLGDSQIVATGHGTWRLRGTPDTPHEDE